MNKSLKLLLLSIFISFLFPQKLISPETAIDKLKITVENASRTGQVVWAEEFLTGILTRLQISNSPVQLQVASKKDKSVSRHHGKLRIGIRVSLVISNDCNDHSSRSIGNIYITQHSLTCPAFLQNQIRLCKGSCKVCGKFFQALGI